MEKSWFYSCEHRGFLSTPDTLLHPITGTESASVKIIIPLKIVTVRITLFIQVNNKNG